MSMTSSNAAEVKPIAPVRNETAPVATDKQKEATGKRRLLVIGLVFVVSLGGYFGYQALTANEETTDDATIEADVIPVSLRVGGQVLSVKVSDNARVKKGDVLVEIDPAEAKAREQQAEGELLAAQAQAAAADAQLQIGEAGARGGLSTAQAQVSTSRAAVGSADAQIASAKAQVIRAESDARKAQIDLDRAKKLRAAEAIPQAQMDSAQAAFDSAQASLQAARAGLSAAEDAKRVAQSRVAEASGMVAVNQPIDAKIAAAKSAADLAHARVKTAEAALELAKLTLSYTTVVAPQDGTVARLNFRVGQLVSPGQMVAQIVPDATYVVANFKETQVGRMKPGQKVAVEVDSFPGLNLEGEVESLMPGTGSRFALLAPDNASGNFVKVVQRVPVRIRWHSIPQDVAVRPGMSAVAHVHVGG